MLRHLAASWLFAGFLVVVAVATWRVLDARPPSPPAPPSAAPAAPASIPIPIASPVLVEAPPPPPATVSSCGASHDPFAAPDVSGTTALQLGTQPFADLVLDGTSMGSTPFYGPRRLDVTVGAHDLVFRDKADGKRYRFRLDVTAADPENKAIFVLNSGQWRTTGALRVTPLDTDMNAAQAKEAFGDAVDAIRDKRTARGCELLETIIDRTSLPDRWHEKADNLHARRCAD